MHIDAFYYILMSMKREVKAMEEKQKLTYRFTVNLNEYSSNELKRISIKEELTTSLIIRKAVDEYLKNYRKREELQIGE